MRARELAAGFALLCAPAAQAFEVPLRVGDETQRSVWVRFETSLDLAAVGQSFGGRFPASWSVSGGIGRIELSAETHAQARVEAWAGWTTGEFQPYVIEIDLATLEATSQPTSGALANPPLVMAFSTHVLSTTATGGFITTTELLCSSQAQLDELCASVPFLCGQTCVLVPAAAYDPTTGRLHLIGQEDLQGCDGSLCSGPFPNFARSGDVRLTEDFVPGVPAASASLRALLAALLAVSAAALTRPRRR